MSLVGDVFQKHLGNPNAFQGVLDDLVYSMLLSVFIGEMEYVLKEEQEGLKSLDKDDLEAKAVATEAISKLQALIDDLKHITTPNEKQVREVIRARYMK